MDDSKSYSGWKKGHLPKICHTYPTMVKPGTVVPYLKKIQKSFNHLTQSTSSADTSAFHWKLSAFGISRKNDIYWILINSLNSLNFLWVFQDFLINMVAVLMMSAKLRLWRYNFCPWRYQQNFITWLT